MSNALSKTAQALEAALHPEFREHITALEDVIDYARIFDPEPEELAKVIEEQPEYVAAWDWAMKVVTENRVSALGGNAYAVPFLHPDVCAKMVRKAKKLGEEFGWSPNEEEEADYQIPEIVVSHFDQRFHDLLAAQAKYLDIWHLILYQTVPSSVTSIQFAKYSPAETEKGNWHHDIVSDFTAVVSLNPGEFTGGGTDIKLTPTAYHQIPPLPAGYALLLNGKQLQHRGRPVTEGERFLLTFWMESAKGL